MPANMATDNNVEIKTNITNSLLVFGPSKKELAVLMPIKITLKTSG
ncbi:hypothetical protein D051_4936 [Vibrio parahaemolyticus VPCR-2010]|nr:hypothetical protein D051_4936 [Vibrio parahaemolyticus VPCR-2010]